MTHRSTIKEVGKIVAEIDEKCEMKFLASGTLKDLKLSKAFDKVRSPTTFC